jgi:hypothetical protein
LREERLRLSRLSTILKMRAPVLWTVVSTATGAAQIRRTGCDDEKTGQSWE